MAIDYSKLRWEDLLAQAQQDHGRQWSGEPYWDESGKYHQGRGGDSFDPYSGGSTNINGKIAQTYLQAPQENSPDGYDMWNSTNFFLSDPEIQPADHNIRLSRADDGSTKMDFFKTKEGFPMGAAAVLAAPFAVSGLQSLFGAPGVTGAAGAASLGGDAAFDAWAAAQGAAQAGVPITEFGGTLPSWISANGITPFATGAATAGASLAVDGADQLANEVSKFINQNAAAPGSLLNTALPTVPIESSWLDNVGDFLKHPLTRVGTSLVNGYMTNRAAEKAVDAETAAAQMGIDEQRRQYDQTRSDLAPYRERGYQASNQLALMMGLQPNAATYKGDMATYKQHPLFNSGYQSAPRYQPGESANALSKYLRPTNTWNGSGKF